jgi:GNAT superfamily N-acetyltransferase
VNDPAGAARCARWPDVPAVGALWQKLVEAHAELGSAFALRPGADAELPRLVAEMLDDPDAAVWVWEGPAGVSGFCTARRTRAPGSAEGQRVEITELMVSPPARRSGVGRALVETALAWASTGGARRVEVRVAAGNSTGQAFWRALGFGDLVDVLDRRL